jgi:hypothetical protein
MAGEMYRSPGETFYRLIRGESSSFKCAASAWELNGELRARPPKSEIAHRGYRPHIPRPWCECVAQRDDSWPVVDILRPRLKLCRQPSRISFLIAQFPHLYL